MGFIKNIIAGIVGFFQGLFGKKDSGYFLEIDDSTNTSTKPASKAVKVGTPEPAAIANPSSTAKTVSAPPAAKPAKAGKKSTAKAKSKTAASAPTAPMTPEEIIAAAVSRATTPPPRPEAETKGFASDFELLMSNQNGRRLPGPSLNPFREMARKSKAVSR